MSGRSSSDVTVQGLSAEQLDMLIEKAGGYEQVRRIISGELEIQLVAVRPPIEQFVNVPTGDAFEARVARGKYGWRNEGLTEERFPVSADQCGEAELRCFHFARSISSEEAIRLIQEAGFEPARTGHVLAFGERFPEEQRRYPVVGLGSRAMVDMKSCVPALWFDGDNRTLDLIWFEGDWHRNYRFLGVRRRAGA